MGEWPTPRPSPHYKLKVWDVLADRAFPTGPTAAPSPSPLLPLLASTCSSAEPPEFEDPLDELSELPVGFATGGASKDSASFSDSYDGLFEAPRPRTCPPIIKADRCSIQCEEAPRRLGST